ncbi:MAG TPA: biotin/lipoyl-binding protein, partial [Allocoleopsis sp.]
MLLTLPLASCRGDSPESAAPPAVPVKLQVVQSSTVIQSSQFVGTLESTAKVDLRPETQGRIVNVLVQPGDRVNSGTPILTIQPGQT